MTRRSDRFIELSTHLNSLLDHDPAKAVEEARKIEIAGLDPVSRIKFMGLHAAILVDGGSILQQQDVIEKGVELFREIHKQYPTTDIIYNLANGIVAAAGNPPHDQTWLDHREKTRNERAEAGRYYWDVSRNPKADPSLQTQPGQTLANQFNSSYRLGEAQDGWRTALKADPENGVAAFCAALNLCWRFEQGGCSELTRIESSWLRSPINIGSALCSMLVYRLPRRLKRSPHSDPFVHWVERERLTLGPTVELVDPGFGKLDWLMLYGIVDRGAKKEVRPPPVFAMFSNLKSDFILARHLVWQVISENAWPDTGRFSDTLDNATYGPTTAALILAHRMAIDLLDKIVVTANPYFEFGKPPDKVHFHNLWRQKDNQADTFVIAEKVEKTIHKGVPVLYALVEIADDLRNSDGILHPQKELRNAGIHRFIVLHDMGNLEHSRQAPEIEHHDFRRVYRGDNTHASPH